MTLGKAGKTIAVAKIVGPQKTKFCHPVLEIPYPTAGIVKPIFFFLSQCKLYTNSIYEIDKRHHFSSIHVL